MEKIRRLALLAAALLLTGCGSTKPVVQTEYVFREVPASMLLTYARTAPPKKEEYLAMSCEMREKTWMDIYTAQDIALYHYTSQVLQQRDWNTKQKEQFSKSKEAP